MAAATFRIEGLTELSDQLAALPAELQQRARFLTTLYATRAMNRIRETYPARTGDGAKSLRNKLKVKTEESTFSASAIVVNTSPLAAIFEFGTMARHTALGANRGSMPAGHVFIRIDVEERRAMSDAVRALLTEAGLTVTGDF